MCLKVPNTGFITFENTRCQHKGEALKLVNLTVPFEMKELMAFPVDWYLKVSIFQVQFYHPVIFLDEVWEYVQPLHFEVLSLHKVVQGFQIYYRSLTSILLFH